MARTTTLTAESSSLRKGSKPHTDPKGVVATPADVATLTYEVAVQGVPPAPVEVAAEGLRSTSQGAVSEDEASEWFWNYQPKATTLTCVLVLVMTLELIFDYPVIDTFPLVLNKCKCKATSI